MEDGSENVEEILRTSIHPLVGRFTEAEKPTCWCENCIVPPLFAEPREFPNLSKTVTETELEMFPCIVTLLMGRGEKMKSEVTAVSYTHLTLPTIYSV